MNTTSVIIKSVITFAFFIIFSVSIAVAKSPEQDLSAEMNITVKTCVFALEHDNSDLSILSKYGYKKFGRNYKKTLQKPYVLILNKTKVYVRPKFKGKYYHCDIEISPVRRKYEPDFRPALFQNMKKLGFHQATIKNSKFKNSLGFQKGKLIIEVRGYNVLHSGSSGTHLKLTVKK